MLRLQGQLWGFDQELKCLKPRTPTNGRVEDDEILSPEHSVIVPTQKLYNWCWTKNWLSSLQYSICHQIQDSLVSWWNSVTVTINTGFRHFSIFFHIFFQVFFLFVKMPRDLPRLLIEMLRHWQQLQDFGPFLGLSTGPDGTAEAQNAGDQVSALILPAENGNPSAKICRVSIRCYDFYWFRIKNRSSKKLQQQHESVGVSTTSSASKLCMFIPFSCTFLGRLKKKAVERWV